MVPQGPGWWQPPVLLLACGAGTAWVHFLPPLSLCFYETMHFAGQAD